MIKNYGVRLFTAFLLIIVMLLLLLSGLGYVKYKDYHLNNLEARLTKEANLIADMTRYRNSSDQSSRTYQEICDTAAKDSAARVTIVNADGIVLGDSAVESDKLDNHSNRPEVYAALHGQIGVDIRYSDTLEIDMLYVAVPFTDKSLSGAVRLAMPLQELQNIYNNALMGILLSVLACGLLAILLSLILARSFSRPLKDITAAVQDMAGGNLKRRVSVFTEDEMGILARAFNEMGQHIENSMHQVSEAKNRLEAMLNNTVNGIVMIDGESRVVFANPTSKILLSLSENYIGRKYVEVISIYEILSMIDEAIRARIPVKRSIVLHTMGAKIVEVNVVPIIKRSLGMQDILLILNDITELKRLEQVRKDFVANISHELKTPVASISGFAETLLSEGGKDPENVVEFSRIIYDEAQRLNYLINELLLLSKLESDKFTPSLQNLNIDLLIMENVARMSQMAGLRNIRIKYDNPDNISDMSSDPELIAQILTNLLDNAMKYSPDGADIEVSLQDLGSSIKMTVKDYGIGIPENEIPRIFERFYRVDKARSRKTGGTGLGLAIVKHLVENLNGQIGVESFPGRGSSFYVFLPK